MSIVCTVIKTETEPTHEPRTTSEVRFRFSFLVWWENGNIRGRRQIVGKPFRHVVVVRTRPEYKIYKYYDNNIVAIILSTPKKEICWVANKEPLSVDDPRRVGPGKRFYILRVRYCCARFDDGTAEWTPVFLSSHHPGSGRSFRTRLNFSAVKIIFRIYLIFFFILFFRVFSGPVDVIL